MAGKPPEENRLTDAQRRAVTGADAATGEVRAPAATRQRLERLGLTRPHGRLGAHYLTDRGRAVRERLLAPAPGAGPAADEEAAVGSPLTGDERTDGIAPESGAARAAAAAGRWEALLEIRRLTGPGSGPADWERARPVHAVALALESAGIPASAVDGSGRRVRTGYRVSVPGDADGETGIVRVEWRYAAGAADAVGSSDTSAQLAVCARRLASCGWAAERYLGAGRRPYLSVAPGTPGPDRSG